VQISVGKNLMSQNMGKVQYSEYCARDPKQTKCVSDQTDQIRSDQTAAQGAGHRSHCQCQSSQWTALRCHSHHATAAVQLCRQTAADRRVCTAAPRRVQHRGDPDRGDPQVVHRGAHGPVPCLLPDSSPRPSPNGGTAQRGGSHKLSFSDRT
jgi:hypothetical protein